MRCAAGELAKLVNGFLVGDADRQISQALPLATADHESITFLANAKHQDKLKDCRAAAVLVPTGVVAPNLTTIAVANPMAAMQIVAHHFCPPIPAPEPGIDETARIHPTAKIGARTHIGAYVCVAAHAEIGDDCIIHSHVVIREHCKIAQQVEIHPQTTIYPRTQIGPRSIIHAGAVIGRQGFGFLTVNGVHQKIPQLGSAKIGADVEIGANSSIDCATFGTTEIGDGTKVDNLVQIAHNCQIGKHNILVAFTGLGGSCTTGDYVVAGGKVGIADHVNIGAQVLIGANSGIHADLPGPGKYMGAVPCMPETQGKRVAVSLLHLPEIRKQVAKICRVLGIDKEADDRKAAG